MRRSHVYYTLCGLALVMTSCDAGFPMGGGGYGRQGGNDVNTSTLVKYVHVYSLDLF